MVVVRCGYLLEPTNVVAMTGKGLNLQVFFAWIFFGFVNKRVQNFFIVFNRWISSHLGFVYSFFNFLQQFFSGTLWVAHEWSFDKRQQTLSHILIWFFDPFGPLNMIFSFFEVLPMTDTPIGHFISFNDFIINPNMLQDLISVFLRCKKSDVLWIHTKHHDHLVLDYSSVINGCRQLWELVKIVEPLCNLFLQFFCALLDHLGFFILPLLYVQKNLLFDVVSLFLLPIFDVFYPFLISIFSELST